MDRTNDRLDERRACLRIRKGRVDPVQELPNKRSGDVATRQIRREQQASQALQAERRHQQQQFEVRGSSPPTATRESNRSAQQARAADTYSPMQQRAIESQRIHQQQRQAQAGVNRSCAFCCGSGENRGRGKRQLTPENPQRCVGAAETALALACV